MNDNLPRRFNRVLLRVGLLFAAAVGAASLLALVRFLPVPEKTNFWDSVFDTGHILIFGLLTVAFLVSLAVILERRWLASQYLVAAMTALAIGLGVEYWQKFNDRSAEFIDVVNDVIGICSFSMFFAMFDWRLADPRKGCLRPGVLFMLASCMIGLGLLPFVRMAGLYRERRVSMPVLVEFKDSWDEVFFYNNSGTFESTSPPAGWPNDEPAKSVGKFSFYPSKRYAGVVMHEPYPDWTGYEFLEFDLYYEAKAPRKWILRVHDHFHQNEVRDRFRKALELKPGFQTIRIPLAEIERAPMMRNLHLKFIAGWSLFTIDLDEPESISFSHIGLTK